MVDGGLSRFSRLTAANAEPYEFVVNRRQKAE